MEQEELEDEYFIHIDYEPDIDNLADSLRALSKVVEGHSITNGILAKAFDQQVVSSIALKRIENGSIRLFIKNVLKNTDHEEIKTYGVKAFLRQAMVEGRNVLLNYMDNNDEIKKIEDLRDIRGDLVTVANNAGALHTIGVESLTERNVAEMVGGLSLPHNDLRKGQKIKVIVAGEEHEVSRKFRFKASKVDEVLLVNDETFFNQVKRIRIKRLAYEGESRWLVQDTDGHDYKARILHQSWLQDFHNGTLPSGDFPKPKSILVVRGNITIQLDNLGFHKDRIFDIHEVMSIENPSHLDSQINIEYILNE